MPVSIYLECMNVRLSAVNFVGEDKAVYSSALRCHTGNISITNCTFSNCSGLLGGAVVVYLCYIIVENSIFMNNSAEIGGVMYLHTSWVESKEYFASLVARS